MKIYGGLVFLAPSPNLSVLISCYTLRTSTFLTVAGAACLSGGDDGSQLEMRKKKTTHTQKERSLFM